MKLSQSTIDVLKNFSTINSNIVISPGSELATVAEAKNVMAEATITETFDSEIGIYDLGEFLSIYGMFTDPTIEAKGSEHILIKESGRSVKYYLSDSSMLTSPSKKIKMPSTDIEFTLSPEDLNSIRKASSALGCSDLVITNEEGKLKALVTDISNDTSNEFAIDLSGTVDEDLSFKIVFAVKSLKIVDNTYTVSISKKNISKFVSSDITYYIALEKSSKFGA